MINKLRNIDWVRTMFLVPILLVAGISISHVVSWYDMANPYNWAIYLSVAIEVGAMTSLVAATKRIKGGVWFMFGIVTFIQVLGNIFYSYANIDEADVLFQKWIELMSPVFEVMGTDPGDIIPHKRWLALLEGGLLPLISLTSLHFYTKYEKSDDDQASDEAPTKPKEPKSPKIIQEPNTDQETISVIPNNEPVGPLVEEDDKPLGKYDMKFGPEYTKMMKELNEEEAPEFDEDHALDMVMNDMVKDMDFEDDDDDYDEDVIEEVDPNEEIVEEQPIGVIESVESPNEFKESITPSQPENIGHQKFMDNDNKIITYKRDKITQKRIR